MKLKRLYIQNLASIEEADIDFEATPLADCHLFAITGETGTGKSTIIDAICLALYGTTPRLDAASGQKAVFGEDELTPKSAANMLRHGTTKAEVRLGFEVEGAGYEAIWTVARARTGRIQPAKQLLFGPNEQWQGSQVAPKVAELMGLDFPQFSRTTMLAQGEFAKFLKSDANTKATILEKLAHTEIYSQIGKAIFENCKKFETQYKELSLKLEENGKRLLSDDELVEQKSRLVSVQTEEPVAQKQLAELEARAKQLDDYRLLVRTQSQLVNEVPAMRKRYRDAMAALNAENEEVRKLAESLQQMESRQATEVEQKRQMIAEADGATVEAQKTSQEASRQLEEAKPEEVEKRYSNIIARVSDIDAVAQLLTKSGVYHQRQAEAQSAIEDLKKELQHSKEEMDKLEERYDVQQREFQVIKNTYEATKLKIDDAAKRLRSQLKVGDDCPVCGRRIESLVDEHEVRAILEPLQKQLEIANQAVSDTDVRRKTLVVAIEKRIPQEVKRQEIVVAEAQKALDELKPHFFQMMHRLALFPSPSMAEVQATLADARKEAVEERTRIEQQRKVVGLLRQRANQAASTYNQCLLNDGKLQAELGQMVERHRNERKQTEGRYQTLTANVQSIVEHRTAILERWEEWASESVAECMRSAAPTTALWSDLRNAALSLRTRLDDVALRLQRATPFSEEEAQRLSESLQQAKERVSILGQQAALIQNALDSDRENHRIVDGMRADLEVAQIRYRQWSELEDMFGGSDGAKFKKVAQSFVLGDLVGRANGYLASLSKRYRLDCEPGTLNLRMTDLYQDRCQMPVDLLSGGESFLCSLALALALSTVNRRGFSIDTLFIDEGFGSLGDNELEMVIGLLQHLHELNGKRVGVISHVKALEERIPVHIVVRRADPTKSVIEMVDRTV